MTADLRRRALAFLLGELMLSPPEAARALRIAAGVLRLGLTRLQETAARNDAPGCGEAAHALKGNLLNLGLADLARQAQEAGDLARAGDTGAAGNIGETLARRLGPLLAPGSH